MKKQYVSIDKNELLRASRKLSKKNMILYTWICSKVNCSGEYVPKAGPEKLLVGQYSTNSFVAGTIILNNCGKRKEECSKSEWETTKTVGRRALALLEREGFIQLHKVKSAKGRIGYSVVTLNSIYNAVYTPKKKGEPRCEPLKVNDNKEDTENSATVLNPDVNTNRYDGKDVQMLVKQPSFPNSVPPPADTTKFNYNLVKFKGLSNNTLAELYYLLEADKLSNSIHDIAAVEWQINKRKETA